MRRFATHAIGISLIFLVTAQASGAQTQGKDKKTGEAKKPTVSKPATKPATNEAGVESKAPVDPDIAMGKKLFSTHCASCHANGTNLVKRSKPVKGSSYLVSYPTFKQYLALPLGDMPHYQNLIKDDNLLGALYKYSLSLDKGTTKAKPQDAAKKKTVAPVQKRRTPAASSKKPMKAK